MQTATKQDVQTAVDQAKARIIDRLLSKNDLHLSLENLRVRLLDNFQDLYRIQEFWQQHQQLARQANLIQEATAKRLNAIETRLAIFDQDVKAIKQLLFKILDNQRILDQAVHVMPRKLYEMPISELEKHTKNS